jgi:hypothetical protein
MFIQRNSTRVTRICGVFLKPGITEVSDDMRDRFLNDREFKHALKTGVMSIVGATATVTAKAVKIEPTGPEPGPDMPVRELEPLIAKMTDAEALERLAKRDNRATIQRAVVKQLNRLQPPPPEEPEDKMTDAEIERAASESDEL